jgi:hypothetical protein
MPERGQEPNRAWLASMAAAATPRHTAINRRLSSTKAHTRARAHTLCPYAVGTRSPNIDFGCVRVRVNQHTKKAQFSAKDSVTNSRARKQSSMITLQ